MTDLEKSIALGLRLSDSAATKLIPEIDRNIRIARAELIRLGISQESAESDDVLIENAIITYSIGKMSDESLQEKYASDFKYLADNLRKSGGYA